MQLNFKEYLQTKFDQFDFKVVVYDEVEDFRDYDHELFDYPYLDRKTQISSQKINIDLDETTYEYTYNIEDIYFQISQTCLEPSPLDQFKFASNLYKHIVKFWEEKVSNKEDESADIFCEGQTSFQKVKYLSSKKNEYNYLDIYEAAYVDDKILYEFRLGLDPSKLTSFRYST